MKARMVHLAVALALVLSLAAAMVPASVAMAADTWYVDWNLGTDDAAHGTGLGAAAFKTIDYAVGQASGGDTIVVAAGTYLEHRININKSLTIQGAGPGTTIVDGAGGGGVFSMGSYTVFMSGMTIRNGRAAMGGGVLNEYGDLTMVNCAVADNGGAIYGGGIGNYGTLEMIDCTVGPDNEATDAGGGIYNEGGSVTLRNCTVTGNRATDGDGGGISHEDGTMALINCTLSGNSAYSYGGAIYCNMLFGGTLTLNNCTVTGNAAHETEGHGGGMYLEPYDTREMICSIVYGNTAGSNPDIDGSLITSLENIIGSPDPRLGPLQDNGGLTETHALGEGSPAIDMCRNNCSVAADQRGVPRPQGAQCDVGAYEYQGRGGPDRADGLDRADGSDSAEGSDRADGIPSVALWGGVGLAVVLAGFLAWTVRRRLAARGRVR